MNPGLSTELFRVIIVLLLAGLAGRALHMGFLLMFLVMVVSYARHLFALYRLRQWVSQEPLQDDFPEVGGALWSDVFYRIYQMKRQQQRIRQRLENVLERARTSIDALEEAVILIDGRGNLEWWNPSATALLGLKEIDRNHPVTNFLRDPRFVDYFRSGDYREPLSLPSMMDPQRHLQYEITRFGENDRLIICWDVTVLRNLEKMRKEFVANVSHELRTPLTVFRGYLETMAEGSHDMPPRWVKAVGQMQAQAQRMAHIVNDLLTLSRLESSPEKGREVVIDIPAMIQEIRMDALVYGADKSQTIHLHIDPHLKLFAISEDIRSAFMNLVTNAVKYSPPDGEITLRWWRDFGGAYFVVEDQGIGIDTHHMPRLTERFYRIDVSRSKRLGGTGLGLAIVKHVLINHDAELSVESELGKGSMFMVHFKPERVRIQASLAAPEADDDFPQEDLP